MMKKIIAGAAAAILAVSTLATAAFAADETKTIAIKAADITQYNAISTGDAVLDAVTDGQFIEIVIADGTNDKVVAATITVTNTNGKTFTKTLDKAGKFQVTTSEAASFKDLPMTSTAASSVKINVTLTVKSTVENDSYTKADATDATVKYGINTDAATEIDDTVSEVKDNSTVTGAVVNALTLKNSEGREIAAAGKATLTVTFNKAASVEGTAKLVVKHEGASDLELVTLVKKGDTTATFEIPAANLYTAKTEDDDAIKASNITATVAAGDANAPASVVLSYVVAGADAEETTTTVAEETTTVAEETTIADETTADETTVADADVTTAADGKGDNTNTGVALAVIPAIIAGAAVVVSRKRK